ncbi:MAG: ubiquinone/menaquinone biosynthesis methyltransferase [Acidobacteriota bacterium]
MTHDHRIRGIFDSIAHRYDLANDVLSLGIHRLWERRAVRALRLRPGHRLIEVGAGSGRMSGLAARSQPALSGVLLSDLSTEMLRLARPALPSSPRCCCICGDAARLPVQAGICDRAILAYSLRNMPDVPGVLLELHRVLRPGGRLVILEFTRPASALVRAVHLFYTCRIIPVVGGFLTGDRPAYEHLARSIQQFPATAELHRSLAQSGFETIESVPLTLGVACIHSAVRTRS